MSHRSFTLILQSKTSVGYYLNYTYCIIVNKSNILVKNWFLRWNLLLHSIDNNKIVSILQLKLKFYFSTEFKSKMVCNVKYNGHFKC